MTALDKIQEERARLLNSGHAPLHIHLGLKAWRELANHLRMSAPWIDPGKPPKSGEMRLFDIPLTVHRDGRPQDYVAISSDLDVTGRWG